MDKGLAIIMAGGAGERVQPLTRGRSKGAVPFGGKFRLIDFTLSNCVNLGLRRIFVLTQYLSESLKSPHPGGLGHLKRRVRRLYLLHAGSAEAWCGLVPRHG